MRFVTKQILIIFYLSISVLSCQNQRYETTEAKIIELNIEDGEYQAIVEYFVDDIRYTDQFDISAERLMEDSISTPHPGITFTILYDPDNPQRNIIDYKVKIKYKGTE
jgi:hypothetical protein